jgi:hypothetical protein
MADGTSKPISQVKAGDRVADAVPGQAGTQAHTVSKVIVSRTDRDFVDVTVAPVAKGPVRRVLASPAGRLRSKAKVAVAAAVAVGAVVAGGQPAMAATGHGPEKAPAAAAAASAGVALHGGTLSRRSTTRSTTRPRPPSPTPNTCTPATSCRPRPGQPRSPVSGCSTRTPPPTT